MDRMYMFRVFAPLLGVGLLGTGCLQTQVAQQRGGHALDQVNRELVYMQENQRVLQEENRQLRGIVEGLEMELQHLSTDLRTRRTHVDESMRASTRDQASRIAELERQLQRLERQREQDKEAIVDTLSKKIAGLIQPPSSGADRSRRPPRGGYGYEHTVQPGQTLSEIAAAYGVSIAALIRENEIRDPNRLRAGQTLFIPE